MAEEPEEPRGAEKQAKSWLEDNGQALELQVAATLFRNGLPVEQSVVYTDPVEGKAREADLVVDLMDLSGEHIKTERCPILAVIECKHSTKGPWVGVQHFLDPRVLRTNPENILAQGGDETCPEDLRRTGLKSSTGPSGSIFLAAGSGSDRNVAYNATRQALASAQALGKERSLRNGASPNSRYGRGVTMAVVVTSAPLSIAWLGSNEKLRLTRVDGLEVWTDSQEGKYLVTVLTRAGLESWARRFSYGYVSAHGYVTCDLWVDPNFL